MMQKNGLETEKLVDGAVQAHKTYPKTPRNAEQTSNQKYGIIPKILMIVAICMLLYTFIAVTYLLATQQSTKPSTEMDEGGMNVTSTEAPIPAPQPFGFTEKDTRKVSHIINVEGGQQTEEMGRFEPSGVVYDQKRDLYWVVFDNLWSIGKIYDLTENKGNILVGDDRYSEQSLWGHSSYESITWDAITDVFFIISESIEFEDNTGDDVNHPIVHAVTYDENITYNHLQSCTVDFDAPTDNKGFEGLSLLQIDGIKYFVGLCEGNYCSSSDLGKERGHGRVVLFQFEPEMLSENGTAIDDTYQYLVDEGIVCMHRVINTFNLPSYINFTDYSDFEFHLIEGNVYYMLVITQVDSAMWIGQVEWSLDTGPNFDLNEDNNNGTMIQFPKSSDGENQFCNVEGVTAAEIAEIGEIGQIVIVSDKTNDDKSYYTPACDVKEQTISIFQYER